MTALRLTTGSVVLLTAFLLLSPIGSFGASAQSLSGSVDDLKAAFIYNFAKFVEWPKDRNAPGSFTIEVIDDRALSATLTRLVVGKTAQGRSIVVRTGDQGPASADAHIAFIGAVEDAAVAWELKQIGDRPVLTVGVSPRFLQLGGMIRLSMQDSRLRFDISREAVARGGLRASSQLVELSRNRGGHE